MAGIYIHIPFCRQACYYCDFHFSTNTSRQEEMVDSLCREIALQRYYLQGEPIQTIYIGGGTPSLLTQQQLILLMEQIHSIFPVAQDAECTLEANPDDLSMEKLDALQRTGINRLSLGIQSFNDQLLKQMNRLHNARQAVDAFHRARQAGFMNISIDLIYAIPGETTSQWQKDIEQALTLKPEHISSYSLTIEEKTVFGRWAQIGKLHPEPDDTAAHHLEMLVDYLTTAGYEQYEVSNFAWPGFYSRHNSSYWKQQSYLGIGPGAHSYNKESRQFNIRNNHRYIDALQQNVIPAEKEVLTVPDKINEYLLTTLRTQWGTNLQKLEEEYGYAIQTKHGGYIQALIDRNLARLEANHLLLTRKGRMLADKIASDLFQ
jgi:oxygen-independent coproporphyrinogen-3 oxidase